MKTTLQEELLKVLRRKLEQTETGRKVLEDGPTEVQWETLEGLTGRERREAMYIPMLRGYIESLFRHAEFVDDVLHMTDDVLNAERYWPYPETTTAGRKKRAGARSR